MTRERKRRTPNEVHFVMVLPLHVYYYMCISGFYTPYRNLIQQLDIDSTLQNRPPSSERDLIGQKLWLVLRNVSPIT